MDTFRKWLNKPKADDKSLLARFYHADRSLTAVASELDSFDGRAEPDRCSRLVSRLRQGQDKVLAITNLIMEELLREDRAARTFRVKFPEEVLQENLAGQLWFGAECLAAGSSIMNREQESKEMRPLAQAVTKSLGNVRNLLRDQCLRNNVPNSKTLHLDANDSTTEQLYESLKIFDRLFAEFELRYVSAMVQVKTKQEYEMQELICVLYSETLQRALKLGLLEQDKVDAFDPALMFSIPRLAIISGLVIYPRGPLNMDMPADQLSEMFRPFRTILIKIRDLLRTLNKEQLYQLEKLLCTNEDIHVIVPVGTSSIEAPSPDQQNNNSSANSGDVSTNSASSNNSTDPVVGNMRHANTASAVAVESQTPSTSSKKVLKTTSGSATGNRSTDVAKLASRYATRSPSMSSVSAVSSARSTPTASPTPSHSLASTSSVVSSSSTSPVEWTDDDVANEDLDEDDVANKDLDEDDDDDDNDDDDDEDAEVTDDDGQLQKLLDMVSADCASGYLIPNTNFGNLLQPQEVPLTDNFIATSEDEFGNHQMPVGNVNVDAEVDVHAGVAVVDVDVPSTSAALTATPTATVNSFRQLDLSDSSDESEKLTTKTTSKGVESHNASSSIRTTERRHSHHHHHRGHANAVAPHRHSHPRVSQPQFQNSNTDHSHHSHHHHHHHHHHHRHSHRQHSKGKHCSLDGCQTGNVEPCKEDENVINITTTSAVETAMPTNVQAADDTRNDTSSADSSPSSSLSDGDQHEVSLALKAASRMKFKSTENLLHRLFVCIAGVADQLQTNFASDLRSILRGVFLMNMSPSQEELDIPEKTKESELFEFRASEQDVIQQSGGSNQSIYSAEEVNPELDNVFNNSSGSINGTGTGTGSGSGSGSSSSGSTSSNGNMRHSTGGTIQRGHTIDLGGAEGLVGARSNVERSRSLGDQDNSESQSTMATATATGPGTANDNNNSNNRRRLCAYINGRQNNGNAHMHHRNRNNSVGSNSPRSSSSSSSSERNSPVSERATLSTRPTSASISNNINNNNNNNNNNNSNGTTGSIPSTASPTRASTVTSTTGTAAIGNARLSPPAWIPDDKAPRCMSCRTPFTAFRRRHHCRNCGGVFCGVCSNASAPLPKYGLTKAVRVCRDCYVREVREVRANVSSGGSSSRGTISPTNQHAAHMRSQVTTTAGGS